MKKKTIAFGMALMTMVLGTNIMAFAEKMTARDIGGRMMMVRIRSIVGNGWMAIRMEFRNAIILMEMVICCRIQLHWMAIRSMETVHGW